MELSAFHVTPISPGGCVVLGYCFVCPAHKPKQGHVSFKNRSQEGALIPYFPKLNPLTPCSPFTLRIGAGFQTLGTFCSYYCPRPFTPHLTLRRAMRTQQDLPQPQNRLAKSCLPQVTGQG